MLQCPERARSTPPSGLPGSSYLIDASALEDSRTLNAYIQSRTYVPGESPAPSGSDGSPPACFSLDCSTMGAEENWIPCAAC
ncbi:MAG TPA: hypothetical protein PLW21_02600 [Methanothrix sp.]|nr:hypothetical protein [Methanothrix sp.]